MEDTAEEIFAGILENYRALDDRFPGWAEEEYEYDEMFRFDESDLSEKTVLFEWTRCAWELLNEMMKLPAGSSRPLTCLSARVKGSTDEN